MKTTLNRKINKKYQRKTIRKTMRKTIRTRRNKYEQNGGFTFLSGYYAFFCNSKVAEQLRYTHNSEAPILDEINTLLGFKAYSLKLFTKDPYRKTQGEKLHMVIPPWSLVSQIVKGSANVYLALLTILNDLDSTAVKDFAWTVAKNIGEFLLTLIGFAFVVAAAAVAVPLRFVLSIITIGEFDLFDVGGVSQDGGTVVEPKKTQYDTITYNSKHDEPVDPEMIAIGRSNVYETHSRKMFCLGCDALQCRITNGPLDEYWFHIIGRPPYYNANTAGAVADVPGPSAAADASSSSAGSGDKPKEMELNLPVIINIPRENFTIPVLTKLKYIKDTDKFDGITLPNSNETALEIENRSNSNIIDMSKNDIDTKIDIFLYEILLMLNRTNLISHSNTTDSINKTIEAYNAENKIDCCIIIKINKFNRNKFIRKYKIID